VTSLRQLHDLWVECGEQAYAAAAHRDDFAAAQAELLAAAIEWRFEQRELVEAWARALDLPTRSQVELINERLHRLQRRVVELEGSLARGMEPRE
jgi:polyhydroxyalkanoate synthesis regulator phasin